MDEEYVFFEVSKLAAGDSRLILDLIQTSGGKSTKGLCCLFLFIMYFVHDTNLDICKSEENETGNEEGLTSGGKSTKVPVAGQNKRTGRRACTPRFQLYRT